MKKFLLVTLVAVFAFSYNANAQIGVKLGYSFARQTGEAAKMGTIKLDDYKKSLGSFCAGVFFDKDIAPLIDLRLGLDYAPKGVKFEGDNLDIGDSKINYLEVPVLAKVKLGPVYGLGGVYAAYAMNGKYSLNIPGMLGDKLKKIEGDYKFDDNDMKRMDFGLKFGAGLQVGLGPLHAFAQVEYSYGLSDISKVDNVSIHNSVLAITAGILLGM